MQAQGSVGRIKGCRAKDAFPCKTCLPVGGGASTKGAAMLAIDSMNALLHHKLLYTIRISCVQAQGSVGSISGCRAKDAFPGKTGLPVGGGGIYKGGCQLAIDNMNALLHHKLLYTIRISCVKATGSVGSISGCRAKDA